MKTINTAILAVGIATVGLFAFRSSPAAIGGSIKGTINPADGATKVWALSTSDTLRSNVESGSFEMINAKPGTYRIIVEAKPPYKNTAKDNVAVVDGTPTNVGEIKLGQ